MAGVSGRCLERVGYRSETGAPKADNGGFRLYVGLGRVNLVDLGIIETPNLLSANQALFRLSYRPVKIGCAATI